MKVKEISQDQNIYFYILLKNNNSDITSLRDKNGSLPIFPLVLPSGIFGSHIGCKAAKREAELLCGFFLGYQNNSSFKE